MGFTELEGDLAVVPANKGVLECWEWVPGNEADAVLEVRTGNCVHKFPISDGLIPGPFHVTREKSSFICVPTS